MNVPHNLVKIDINEIKPSLVEYIQNEADNGVRVLDVMFLAQGRIIAMENGYTATATVSVNDVLITDNLSCTVDSANNLVKAEIDCKRLQLTGSGVMKVQITVSDGTNILISPQPVLIRLTSDLSQTAQILPDSHSSYSEIVAEIVAARGDYDNLAQALSHLMGFLSSETVDNATETGKVYYTTVGSSKALIVPVSGDSSQVQFRLDRDGKIYARRRSRSSTSVDFPAWGAFEQTGWTSAEISAMIDSLVDPTLSVQGKAADAKAVGDKLDGLPFDLTFTVGDVINNCFIGANGAVINSDSWASTDYCCVPLEKGGTLEITSTLYGNAGMAFYDQNKTCLQAITGNNATEYGHTASYLPQTRTFTVPENTAYVRICVFKDTPGDMSRVSRLRIRKGVGVTQVTRALGANNNKLDAAAEGLSNVNSEFNESIYGVEKTLTIPAGGKSYAFPCLLISGKSYTFKNLTNNGCTLGISNQRDDASTVLSRAISAGQEFSFTVPDGEYHFIRSYQNGTGSCTITGDFSGIAEFDPQMSLVKWIDGNVYFAVSGVPRGRGMSFDCDVTDAYAEGFDLLFEDDFNRGNLVDAEHEWVYELGYKRNNEPQVYQAENVELSNSNMIITARREHVQAYKDGVLTDFDWTSGSVVYKPADINSLIFDRVEAKIKFPRISGASPAFWGLGTIGGYPEQGEIDIVEGMANGGQLDRISAGAFFADQYNTQQSVGRVYTNAYDQDGFHIYSLVRKDGCLTFLIDEQEISSFEITAQMSEFNNPYYWLLNLALYSNHIPETVNEYKMYVDWFRIYGERSSG